MKSFESSHNPSKTHCFVKMISFINIVKFSIDICISFMILWNYSNKYDRVKANWWSYFSGYVKSESWHTETHPHWLTTVITSYLSVPLRNLLGWVQYRDLLFVIFGSLEQNLCLWILQIPSDKTLKQDRNRSWQLVSPLPKVTTTIIDSYI
jgi:hypothetical protein